jgi:6-phosphogluconate dehydrogenase
MSNDEIADLFEQWYNDKVSTMSHTASQYTHKQSDVLRGNFLLGIGFKGLRFKQGDGIKDDRGIVEGIEDKVTQDVDLSEVSTGACEG